MDVPPKDERIQFVLNQPHRYQKKKFLLFYYCIDTFKGGKKPIINVIKYEMKKKVTQKGNIKRL
jgi:hypothetical protein